MLAGAALQQSQFWKVSPVFWRDSGYSRHAAVMQQSCSDAVGQTARVLDSGYCDVITVVELSVSLVTKPSQGQR